jgi:hypothetical protein
MVRSVGAASVSVQTFPVGHGQEGPQQDISGCDEAGSGHDAAPTGAAISDTAIRVWQNRLNHLFTRVRVPDRMELAILLK